MSVKSNCDLCVNYVYDEEGDFYSCLVNLDEDEMQNFLKYNTQSCPYFQEDDEYKIVKHQM